MAAKRKQTAGLFWHVHHEVLFEVSHDINERIKYIKSEKPSDERRLRLRLMKPVQASVGNVTLLRLFLEAKKRYRVLGRKKRRGAAFQKASMESHALEQAFDGSLPDTAVMERIHKLECKNCPWNGATIFPDHPGY